MWRQQASSRARSRALVTIATVVGALCACSQTTTSPTRAPAPATRVETSRYEREETRELVVLVNDAGRLIETGGESAFASFRQPQSRWRQGDTYVFVLDPQGNMVVHADPDMEGKNQLALEDVNGRPIIRGLIEAATTAPGKPEGWYHYEWPVPGGLLPRWKSSYVRLVAAPSGKRYIVGAGMYDDRMERAFVADMVRGAVARIEQQGEAAFPLLRDHEGPFMAKDAYVFVIDPGGVDLVNPAFPNLEGRNILDVRDTQGKLLIRDMLAMVQRRGDGWVEYMWPKPGESVSTQKSTCVTRARLGGGWVLVGAGVYLADAPKAPEKPGKMTAPELMSFVREAAAELERRGEDVYPELRTPGSRWFHDDTYLFIWSGEGKRVFHAADPSLEGQDVSVVKDVVGRPYARMFYEVTAGPSGEGWVHYMYPEPFNLFPIWKSSFIKRVRTPSGKTQLIGAGVYNMKMDRAFIVDVVDRAAALIAQRGKDAFPVLRDKTGPFVFMDTYVFVDRADGVEVVNPAQPSLEGKNLIDLRDVNGKALAREYIDAAMRSGTAWVEYHWYKPGGNTPVLKRAYVRKVQSGPDTYLVGSGLYVED